MRYLGPNLERNKKLEKWGTFVALVTHDCSENLRWKNFRIFIMIWQVYHTKFMNGSQCFHREKICQSLGKNYKFCVAQRSNIHYFSLYHCYSSWHCYFTNSSLNSRILLCLVQSQLLVEAEWNWKISCFISLNTLTNGLRIYHTCISA